MRDRSNLGLTVNGIPLDDGAGLWTPDFFNPTCRGARVTERWGNMTRTGRASAVTTKKVKPKKPPTKEQMLARLRNGER